MTIKTAADPTPKTPPYLCAICNEEFYSKALADEHSHQGADGSITSSIVCTKAPRESYAWRKQEFGEDCEQRHETISKRLLAILCDKFSDIRWGGWAPWRPTMDSQTKAGHVPVEDRYRVTLYLTAEQVAQLPDFRF